MRGIPLLLSVAMLSGIPVVAVAADCSQPPEGVIRFSLAPGGNQANLYEWRGNAFRKVGKTPVGQPLAARFPSGSYRQWDFWGPEVSRISRDLPERQLTLSTPYSLSADGTWLASGAMTAEERKSYSWASRVVLMQVGSQASAKTVEFPERLESVAWSPRADAIVVMTRQERYVKRSLRQRFAAAIGHPIPYATITLTIIGLDGTTRCSIVPEQSISYGSGMMRWDAN
jgi:hypothetical protein